MKVKGDTTGFEDIQELVDKANDDALISIGKEAIKIAHDKRVLTAQKVYQNHTENLHNAPGACVVRNGKVIWYEVAADSAHPEAEEKTRNLLLYSEHKKDGLYLADGMEYASYVSSKGYDVMDSAILHAEKRIKE